MASVTLQNITRRYNNATAIADISFTVPDGEFLVLVGLSGCGKSTLLRTIAGLEAVQTGKLHIGDRLDVTWDNAELHSFDANTGERLQ